ncbi:ATP-binding protein [Selenomonas sp.]|uniref:ATP-binding protein n=1 Tax=Selenomonas sp. TaxID=2053611 RepID=UPI002A7623BE|nr:ATP-binding protein [Selenomonas sp.]MDY3296845.1 ATP-binding protein [Selenomonas sp.]
MFIGRTRERAELQRRYKREGFECIILYGRRRVGKTALIREFCKNKRTIFFTGLETTAKENLQNFSQCIYAAQGGEGDAPVYADFKAALSAVTTLARREKLILVIDEYPYLAKSYPGIFSLLQIFLDRDWQALDFFVILCGSSMNFMERQVLGHESPLFGRRTAQLKLEPFTIFETRAYFPEMPLEDVAVLYGATGGIPFYLAQMEGNASLKENLTRTFFDPLGYLLEEPSNLLKQELREPATYNAILQAIAGGRTKVSQIATTVGIEVSACAGYLKNLIALGIVKRETPLGEKQSKRSIYLLKDHIFRFWYRFVPNHYSMIQNGMGETVYQRIEKDLPDFMGQVFEQICMEWLWRENRNGHLPFLFEEAGRWWGNDARKKQPTEIDIIAQNADKEMLFCECKWRNEPLDGNVLDLLIERSMLFSATKKHYIAFSKRTFSERCVRNASALQNVQLVSFSEMLSEATPQK